MEQRFPQRPDASRREADALIGQRSQGDAPFRSPIKTCMWLECALDMERRKHDAVPIRPDLSADWEEAQAWGYVTMAYMIAEQALKALVHHTDRFDEDRVHLRRRHPLSPLFVALTCKDRHRLDDLYRDYFRVHRARDQGVPQERVKALLGHLDTGQGSVGWR